MLDNPTAALLVWTVVFTVSSATGFLDFMSYMAAAASSTLFANAVSSIGWKNLIFVWFVLSALGIVVALPKKKS